MPMRAIFAFVLQVANVLHAVDGETVGQDEMCNPNMFPSCKIGLPIGRKSPGTSWSSNSTTFAVKASRASLPWRRGFSYKRNDVYGLAWPTWTSLGKTEGVLAIHMGHDAQIVLAIGSRIQCVLELERLFGRRYFFPKLDDFNKNWLTAAETVRDQCECEDGACPATFEYGLIVDFGMYTRYQSTLLPKLMDTVFSVKVWRSVNHHEAHALMAYHSSPFRSAFILSFDGGGNDGTFNAFLGHGLDIDRIGRRNINLGKIYERIGSFLPAVTGLPAVLDKFCPTVRKDGDDWSDGTIYWQAEKREGFAGKLMGYSGIRAPSAEASRWFRKMYQRAEEGVYDMPVAVLHMICDSEEARQAVAASAQDEFAKFVQPLVAGYLLQLKLKGIKVEGIVLVGGCALNVLTNQIIRETLTSFTSEMPDSSKPKDVYVPPAPNDAGLAIGAVWSLFPPTVQQPLQYLGFRLFDLETLGEHAKERGAQKLSDLGGLEYLAELFAGGSAWQADPRSRMNAKPIIAVVRGRQEFGPRALGHRSLLAFPDADMKDRMNRIKFRQWYRPAAPMIADEALEEIFGHKFRSAYMEFAPLVKEDVRKRFPGLSHFDGTARHQSVGKEDEPWIHALLLAVGKRTGLAALINTSFNSKGKPITNTVEESLEMLDTLEDLDFVLIEDWLFRPPAVRKPMKENPEKLGVTYVEQNLTTT
ncbi:Nodulation protein NolNO [Durusdinium trenchii]|uniref:Nodulation protein NolNO n=1 Tax=Durusdinium trenchii TaxID=1381693 RepID=A0ABP0HMW7_9DINO